MICACIHICVYMHVCLSGQIGGLQDLFFVVFQLRVGYETRTTKNQNNPFFRELAGPLLHVTFYILSDCG